MKILVAAACWSLRAVSLVIPLARIAVQPLKRIWVIGLPTPTSAHGGSVLAQRQVMVSEYDRVWQGASLGQLGRKVTVVQ